MFWLGTSLTEKLEEIMIVKKFLKKTTELC